jgi:pyruvate carboxylase subunit A
MATLADSLRQGKEMAAISAAVNVYINSRKR